jgi:hypothetical protein
MLSNIQTCVAYPICILYRPATDDASIRESQKSTPRLQQLLSPEVRANFRAALREQSIAQCISNAATMLCTRAMSDENAQGSSSSMSDPAQGTSSSSSAAPPSAPAAAAPSSSPADVEALISRIMLSPSVQPSLSIRQMIEERRQHELLQEQQHQQQQVQDADRHQQQQQQHNDRALGDNNDVTQHPIFQSPLRQGIRNLG